MNKVLRGMRRYHLGWIILLCLSLTACGGSGGAGGSSNEDASVDIGGAGQVPSPPPGVNLPPSDCNPQAPVGPVLYVATDGADDPARDGSIGAPYATITYALDRAQDGTVILVRPGDYHGRIRIRGTFATGVTVRSEIPYRARLRNDDRVITAYADGTRGCQGITIEGFDIAHDGPGAGALVVHLDAGGDGSVSDITLRNNILHDSYNNDILKINNGISDVVVERNIFYNQTGSDEHIDINSARNIVVQDNIFMNDFAGSGRTNANDTSSYIVVKDSNGDTDRFTGSRNILIRRNVFLNWEGSSGSNFVLLGEDGQDFYEAEYVTIENNLMLGNSANVMRAPFGIKGGRYVVFNNNTISGDLPALAFAMRFNREGANPINEQIEMYNNIWSDPTGTMGATGAGGADDFSDTPAGEVQAFTLNNNLYWNGGAPLPQDANETINISDDADAITADPGLGDLSGLVLPRWASGNGRFADGSATICQAFDALVQDYGTPSALQIIDQAKAGPAPDGDILGNTRGANPDIGAVEVQ
jgi:hypothetical protein